MNHRQVEAFNAFMLLGTVSLAATKLGISQPAVSRLLISFEEDLGIKLFVRKKNKTIPTEEAKSLHKIVIRSFVGMDEISNHARAIVNKQIGSISLSAQAVYVNSYLLDVIAEFKKMHPNVQVTIQEEGMQSMIEKVNTRRCDFGVGVTLNIDSIDVDVTPVTACSALCILPKNHHLATHQFLTFNEVKNEVFVELTIGSPLRMRVDNLFYSHDFLKRNIAAESLTLSTVCKLVEKEVGIAIVDPFVTLFLDFDKVVAKPFTPKIEWQLAIFSAKGYRLNALEEAFLTLMKKKIEVITEQLKQRYG